MKTDGMSRQEKRAAVRKAAKTIGKLNHIIKNPAETVGVAKMQNKNIKQYVSELRALGVIPPPTIWQRIKAASYEIKRWSRISFNFVKHYLGRAWRAFDRFVDNHAI